VSLLDFRKKHWNIIGKRKWYYIFSGCLIIVCLSSLIFKGLNLGLDFKGGTINELKFQKVVNDEEVRSVLKELKLKDEKTGEDIDMGSSMVQQSGIDKQIIIIRSKFLSPNNQKEMLNFLRKNFGEVEVRSTSGVGATIGKELKRNAFRAILIVLILQLIYIAIRFESNFLYGLAVDIALVHDVIVMVGLYSLIGLEADSPFLAALLTVIGYSVMDTIVIFDRIRENKKLLQKLRFEELVNTSILQTMSRSIYTLLTVLFVLIAILLFGGSTLKPFAISLLIGITSGAYSSIFVACPLIVTWDHWAAKQKKKEIERRRAALLLKTATTPENQGVPVKAKEEILPEVDTFSPEELPSVGQLVKTHSQKKKKKKKKRG